MTAAGAFDRVRGIILRHQQYLHFPHFERTQHPAQAGHAAPVAPGLVEDVLQLLVPMLRKRFSHHALALFSHLLFGGTAHFGCEATQQPALDVRVKLGLKVMPVDVLTSDDQPVECPSFERQFQEFRHVLEMVQDFVIHAAFGVAGIVARKSVAASTAGKRPEKGLLLLDFVEMQIEEARPVTIHKSHP